MQTKMTKTVVMMTMMIKVGQDKRREGERWQNAPYQVFPYNFYERRT